MKGMRIWTIGIILVMLFMTISTVYGQDDQAIMDLLLQKRDRLTAEMNAEIGVKLAFNKDDATKVCIAKQCTWTGKDGRILKEEYDSTGNLVADIFTDPINKMELTINYTTNKGIICMSLRNDIEKDDLKVCNPCPLRLPGGLQIQQATTNEDRGTPSYGAFQNQRVWDLKTFYVLRLKVSCCGVIEQMTHGHCEVCPGTKRSECGVNS